MRFLDAIDGMIEIIGKVVSTLILVIIAIIVFELASRTFFDHATAWAHELGSWLQVAFIFLGGAYALKHDQFVRIDLLYSRYSPKLKALIDATASSLLFALFSFVLITRGFDFTYKSFIMHETSATGAWNGPVFIAKSLVFLGGGLLVLAWISKIIRALKSAFEWEA